jgi:hypothetical protein
MTAQHSSVAITARQAARLRSGRVESVPSDYAEHRPTEAGKRLVAARRALEDQRMMRELGLLD